MFAPCNAGGIKPKTAGRGQTSRLRALEAARDWVQGFVRWYNESHRHSGIWFVTPGQRHRGEAEQILAQRALVYAEAKALNPSCWRGETRNWTLENRVWLNPERDLKMAMEQSAA